MTAETQEPVGSAPALAAPDVRLHHLGLACREIAAESAVLEPLGFAREGDDFEDPLQGVRGRFLVGPDVRLELLEELPGSGVLGPWLAGRSRLYHQAYETGDFDRTLERLLAAGAKTARSPLPAAAFGGRRVVFVMLPSMLLVELVESAGE